MKKMNVILLVTICAMFWCCSQSARQTEIEIKNKIQIAKSDTAAFLKFMTEKHDFGKIESNEKQTVIFEFENTGVKPLIIQKVEPTCGCTITDWTKWPVASGQKGFVKAVFNPKGIGGDFSKSIFVKSNAENDVVLLKLKGTVTNR